MSRAQLSSIAAVGLVGCSLNWSTLDPRAGDPAATTSSTTASAGGEGGRAAASTGAAGGEATTSGTGGGGGAPECLIPLVDPFDSFMPADWDVQTTGAACSVDFAQGAMTVRCGAEGSLREAKLASKDEFDFEACSVVVDLESYENGAGKASFGFELVSDSQRFAFEVVGGSLISIQTLGNDNKTLSRNFDAADQRYWQLGGRDGCVYWETSPDGESWVEFRRHCDAAAGRLQLVIYARAAGVDDPVEASLGGVNTL